MSYVGTHAINGALYKKLPFDLEKDFAPIATVATLPFVMVAKADATHQDRRRRCPSSKAGPPHVWFGR